MPVNCANHFKLLVINGRCDNCGKTCCSKSTFYSRHWSSASAVFQCHGVRKDAALASTSGETQQLLDHPVAQPALPAAVQAQGELQPGDLEPALTALAPSAKKRVHGEHQKQAAAPARTAPAGGTPAQSEASSHPSCADMRPPDLDRQLTSMPQGMPGPHTKPLLCAELEPACPGSRKAARLQGQTGAPPPCAGGGAGSPSSVTVSTSSVALALSTSSTAAAQQQVSSAHHIAEGNAVSLPPQGAGGGVDQQPALSFMSSAQPASQEGCTALLEGNAFRKSAKHGVSMATVTSANSHSAHGPDLLHLDSRVRAPRSAPAGHGASPPPLLAQDDLQSGALLGAKRKGAELPLPPDCLPRVGGLERDISPGDLAQDNEPTLGNAAGGGAPSTTSKERAGVVPPTTLWAGAGHVQAQDCDHTADDHACSSSPKDVGGSGGGWGWNPQPIAPSLRLSVSHMICSLEGASDALMLDVTRSKNMALASSSSVQDAQVTEMAAAQHRLQSCSTARSKHELPPPDNARPCQRQRVAKDGDWVPPQRDESLAMSLAADGGDVSMTPAGGAGHAPVDSPMTVQEDDPMEICSVFNRLSMRVPSELGCN